MKTAFLSAIAIFLFATVHAQTLSSASASQTVTLNLSNKIDITLTSGVTGSVFNFTTTSDYENGLTNSSAAEFTVKSNRPWNVQVGTVSDNFSYNGSAGTTVNNTMPASVLGVKLPSSTSFITLKKVPVDFTSSATRGISTFTVDYKATPGFQYDAGAYQISVLYTATQQ